MSFYGAIVCGLLLLCVYHTEAKSTHSSMNHLLNPKATAIHLGLLKPSRTKEQYGTKSCKHNTAVESFTASFYTFFIVTNDPVVLKRLEVPSNAAAKRLKPLIKKILAEEHQCDADYIANEVANTIGHSGTLKLADHYQQAAYGVGEFLHLSGILNCKNAIQLAMEFFGFVENAFSENNSYDSYMEGMVYGLSDFLIAHQKVLKEVTLELADQFFKEFSVGNNGTCDAPASGL